MLEAEQVKQEPVVPEVTTQKVMFLETARPVSRKPIRAPFRIVWREFRFRILPTLAFILAVIGTIIMWRQWVTPQEPAPVASVFAGGAKGIPFSASETVAGK